MLMKMMMSNICSFYQCPLSTNLIHFIQSIYNFPQLLKVTQIFPPEDAKAGQARGTGGKDSKAFKQEITVKKLFSVIMTLMIFQTSKLEVECVDTKQTIEKLPPPFIYFRSENVADEEPMA